MQAKNHPVKISVIMPVYNTERYLKRCLISILNNSYENLEIIWEKDQRRKKKETDVVKQ